MRGVTLPASLLIAIALKFAVLPSPTAGPVAVPPPVVGRGFSPGDAAQIMPGAAPARPRRRANTVSFRLENDMVAGTDENYTNGASITVSKEAPGPLGGIWKWFGVRSERRISSYELSQVIMTPGNIRRPVPDPTDRPYAGLLLFAVSTQSVHDNRFDGLKLMTGVVGPASLAAKVQTSVHEAIGSPEPLGWKYQLKNEPIVNLVYEHRRRYTLFDSQGGWGAEAIPLAGAMLGNFLTQVQADTQFRFGYNLPDDFGTTLMRGLGNLPYPRSRHDATAHRFGIYAFAGGGGNLVARNITLDGNTFQDSPRVAKKPFFAAGEAGVSVWTQRLEVTFTYVYCGREFVTQYLVSRFGTLTMGVHF